MTSPDGAIERMHRRATGGGLAAGPAARLIS